MSASSRRCVLNKQIATLTYDDSRQLGVFFELAMGTPVLFACIAAYVVCRLRWKQVPRPALFCLLGFALITVSALGGALFSLVMENMNFRGSVNINLAQLWLRVFRNLIDAAGLVLLLIAVFTDRRRMIESNTLEATTSQSSDC